VTCLARLQTPELKKKKRKLWLFKYMIINALEGSEEALESGVEGKSSCWPWLTPHFRVSAFQLEERNHVYLRSQAKGSWYLA
jgi:hypothetical protein